MALYPSKALAFDTHEGFTMKRDKDLKKRILEEWGDDIRVLRYEEFYSYERIRLWLQKNKNVKVSVSTINRVCRELGVDGREINLKYKLKKQVSAIPVEAEGEEDNLQPIEDLISARVKASQYKSKKAKKHQRNLTFPAEPIGVIVFGDPHIDNDGCDWETLFEHIELANSMEGVLACCVGDVQDNWIGRLAKLYANASITASDGWRLSRWFLESMQWLAIVGGNHDSWAHAAGVDPLGWIAKDCGVLCYAPDEIRMTIHWKDRPDLEPLIWVLRHDFRGRSWFHPTHGPHKEAILDGRCHILTAGHIHQWGELITEQRHGRVTHSIRVRGYKRNDSFAIEKGFFEQQSGEACLIVIDPFGGDTGRVNTFWNIPNGLEYLKVLRTKY